MYLVWISKSRVPNVQYVEVDDSGAIAEDGAKEWSDGSDSAESSRIAFVNNDLDWNSMHRALSRAFTASRGMTD